MNKDLIRKGIWIFLIASGIFVTFFFGYILIGLIRMIYFPPVSVQVTLREVNQSDVESYVVHFSPKDLNESKSLAFLMKHHASIMTEEEWKAFQETYSPGSFVEYNGTYYALYVHVHRGEQ